MRLSSRRTRFAPLFALVLGFCACDTDKSAGAPIAEREQVDEGPLPHLSQVPHFSLLNQAGEAFGSDELKGRPYLAAFMFTRCPSICPELMARMKQVDTAVKKAGRDLQIVNFSVDPENDTPEVLAAYAKKHRADVPGWTLLTGDYKVIAQTSEQGFKVGLAGTIDQAKPHLGITHGSHLVLVDGAGVIRGYFRSSEDSSVSDIVKALGRL